MSFTLGRWVRTEVSGASHSDRIEVTVSGLPEGETIDMDEIRAFLKRRQGGNASYTTARKEADEPFIKSGVRDEGGTTVLTGEPLVAYFVNSNAKSSDYKKMRTIPRPSHADYVAYVKYKGQLDMAGGGFFSGRMTLPMCFAGAVCLQILKRRGIDIRAHILSVGDVEDEKFDPVKSDMEPYADHVLPVLSQKAGDEMTALMESVSREGDSVGGVISCVIKGCPVGIGEPEFDKLHARLGYAMLGINAAKGFEIGDGFSSAFQRGSEANDLFDEGFTTRTNHSGGVQGGISNGQDIFFRVAFKPVATIIHPQQTIDIQGNTTTMQAHGRHDPCVVPRAVPIIEAMAAMVVLDQILLQKTVKL